MARQRPDRVAPRDAPTNPERPDCGRCPVSDRHTAALVRRGNPDRLVLRSSLGVTVSVRPAIRRQYRALLGPPGPAASRQPPLPGRYEGAQDTPGNQHLTVGTPLRA